MQLFSENSFRRLQPSEIDRNERPCVSECPAWFAPKPVEEYEVWTFEDAPEHNNFRLLIDKSTGQIFLGDYQL